MSRLVIFPTETAHGDPSERDRFDVIMRRGINDSRLDPTYGTDEETERRLERVGSYCDTAEACHAGGRANDKARTRGWPGHFDYTSKQKTGSKRGWLCIRFVPHFCIECKSLAPEYLPCECCGHNPAEVAA